jgi:hydroxymethylpyrimidine/phosphomethylpyrimidine kinase
LHLHSPSPAQPQRLTTRIVVVGGIDPSAGAGLARDLLTTAELGARASLVGTAWTQQGLPGAATVEPRQADHVRASLVAALAGLHQASSAVKIGMVATTSIARAIALTLDGHPQPMVFDPVLRASSGMPLFDGDRAAILDLARRSTLLTPNLAEAEWLLDRPVRSASQARDAARTLRGLGIAAVLVKGGHLDGDATDVLLSRAGETLLTCPRITGPSPRGTGCALATAIAVELARGETLERAVARAKTWLAGRIEQATPVGGERHL